MQNVTENHFKDLSDLLEGELVFDSLSKVLYATDASVYRKIPQAVCFPKSVRDIQTLVKFATHHKIGIIPRAAGTSLAGQCVGDGIVVDVSKYFTNVLEIDEVHATVTVQPGVIRDDLNRILRSFKLFFAPDTSTSNRCMLGGMVGNNSSGTTSIQYGVTRDKVLEIEGILSDGSLVTFKEFEYDEFFKKTKLPTLEGKIYKTIYELLKDEIVQKNIKNQFPKPEIHRRNTGYAIDELIKSDIFTENGTKINICKLLAGSEGTLVFTTKIKLKLDKVPPPHTLLVAAHFESVQECMKAVLPAMQHNLFTCEMMDKVILDCTRNNLKYKENRFFIQGDPKALLLLEIRADTILEAENNVQKLIQHLQYLQLGYAFPILRNTQIEQALDLRKAGLGLLGNIVGDEKTVPCIEDTAVALPDLENYIQDFSDLMDGFHQKPIYYAHAGAGELHLRPVLNMKKSKDVLLFKEITKQVAILVKKYQGSMSGEHGDGIVRSSFIPMMIGTENYEIIKSIKSAFDPHCIFNPGKIVASYPIDKNLRYQPDRVEQEVISYMDFSDSQGILRTVEKCNGSGDCRKSEEAGGTMCPSYRVTKNEKDTTRGRANALREFLTQYTPDNSYNHPELKDVLDLCIACKGCKNECPSNIDMAALKSEFLYQYQKQNPVNFRTKFFANNHFYNQLGKKNLWLSNTILSGNVSSKWAKRFLGISKDRSFPKLSKLDIRKAFEMLKREQKKYIKKVYFFVDEFTEDFDAEIGIDALYLLDRLGYEVSFVNHEESGRSYFSKGFLEQAKNCVDKNVSVFKEILSKETSLIGIEPSAILSFRDEYLRLATDVEGAKKIAEFSFTIEEFLNEEITSGNIHSDYFTNEENQIKLHVHCHQKALSSIQYSYNILNLPRNFQVSIIPSGCCGMAGSFGFEKEHFEISMQMGELSLFPAIRKAKSNTLIAATGTSCRHQIKDGTQKTAFHPVTILRNALTSYYLG